MKYAGIITAAGLSSRMGSFKPLMEINGLPMICHTVLSMKNAGLAPICVVTGYRGDEIRHVLRGYDVSFAENKDPANSDMLRSIQLGIEQVKDADGFFLLPGDMPLIPKEIFASLISENGDYVIPRFDGKNAHPPRISKKCFESILSFDGSGGMPAALADVQKVFIDVQDASASMDADYLEEFEHLKTIGRAKLGIGDSECHLLLSDACTPSNVISHCQAVAELSVHMAEKLIFKGIFLDLLLCKSGALLHDIMRNHSDHANCGADYLEKKGYIAVSQIVRSHMTGNHTSFSEASIVFLADKLIQETSRVSLKSRYLPSLTKYPENTEIGSRIRKDYLQAKILIEKYTYITVEKL